MNDKELNELVGEYYFDKHVAGKVLRRLFVGCFILGKDYAAMLPSQRKRLIEDLQAAKNVLKEMRGGK